MDNNNPPQTIDNAIVEARTIIVELLVAMLARTFDELGVMAKEIPATPHKYAN